MQPTFISVIKRPTSGPLLWLHSLNRSFIWIFPPSNEIQAADTPTKTGVSFRQELFLKYLPHSKISIGHQSLTTPIKSLLEPSMILHQKKIHELLAKEEWLFEKLYFPLNIRVSQNIQPNTFNQILLPRPILPLLLSPSST